MDNKLGARIKSLREEKDISQLELARILNISNSTLSQYEAGNRVPSDEIKIKIADYFSVSLDYLLGRSDIRNPYKDISHVSSNKTDKHFDIDELSPESQKELQKYIELLKLKDKMDKTRDETSSALDSNAQ